jgi:hypothetical protein
VGVKLRNETLKVVVRDFSFVANRFLECRVCRLSEVGITPRCELPVVRAGPEVSLEETRGEVGGVCARARVCVCVWVVVLDLLGQQLGCFRDGRDTHQSAFQVACRGACPVATFVLQRCIDL